jgi:hypothetical protein
MLVGEKPADEWSERPESKYTQDTEPSRSQASTYSAPRTNSGCAIASLANFRVVAACLFHVLIDYFCRRRLWRMSGQNSLMMLLRAADSSPVPPFSPFYASHAPVGGKKDWIGQIRRDEGKPPTSLPGIPEPLFNPQFDGKGLTFQLSHRHAHADTTSDTSHVPPRIDWT